MIKRSFQDIRFKEDKDKQIVEAIFLDHFFFEMSFEELNNIGDFTVGKDFIEFNASEKKMTKFDFILSKGFDNLINRITGKRTIYLHKKINREGLCLS